MKYLKLLSMLGLFAFPMVGLVGCDDNDNVFEEAGEDLDDAVDDAGDDLKGAGDEVEDAVDDIDDDLDRKN